MVSETHLKKMLKWNKHCVDCDTLIAIHATRCVKCSGKTRCGENNPVFGKPAWNRGREHPPETRRRISEALKGKPGNNKGKKFSKEWRDNISKSKKKAYAEGRIIPPRLGKKLSKEEREKIGLFRRGKTYEQMYSLEKTKKIKEKISKANMGRPAWMKGKHHTEEAKKKISNSLKGKHHSEETKRKIGSGNKGKIISEEQKKILSESRKGKTPWNKGKENPQWMGENNPNWCGGKSFEEYGIAWNKKFKKTIRKRDGCCVLCNIPFNDLHLLKRRVHIHHIDYNKLNTFPQNCISLCHNCHTMTNHNREIWTKHFQELLKKLYGYEYTSDQKIILNYI